MPIQRRHNTPIRRSQRQRHHNIASLRRLSSRRRKVNRQRRRSFHSYIRYTHITRNDVIAIRPIVRGVITPGKQPRIERSPLNIVNPAQLLTSRIARLVLRARL